LVAWLCLYAAACSSSERSGRPPQLGPAAAAPVEDRAARVKILLDSSRALAAERMWMQAEVDLRKALELSYGFVAPWPEYRADGLTQLATCLLAQQRYAEARTIADQGLGAVRAGSLDDDRQLFALQSMRAEAFRAEQQAQGEEGALNAALDAAFRHPREMTESLIDASLRLAEHQQRTGQQFQATKTLERALTVARSGSQRSLALRVAEPLALSYEANGEPKRAHELRREHGLSAPPANATGTATESVRGIASMQADFRACYQASLEHESAPEGGVRLLLRVGADGRVAEVTTSGLKLPRSTVECLVKRASLARFEPPKGGSATILVPVTFVKQD
jgi:tetratricopeptide (TPR) repeat protein